MILNLFLQPFLGVLWINTLTEGMRNSLGIIPKILFSGFFILTTSFILFNLLKYKKLKNKNIYTVFTIFLALNIFYTFVGFNNGFGGKIINDFIGFIAGPLIMISFQQSDMKSEEMERFYKTISYIVVFAFASAIGIMYYETFIGIKLYFGLPCISLSFAFYYFFLKKAKVMTIITLMLIILSGKRGVAVSLITSGILTFLLHKGISFKTAVFTSVLLIVPFFLTIFWALSTVADTPRENLPIVNRMNRLNPFLESGDVESCSGERVEEIEQSIAAQEKFFLSSIIGAGNGFTYQLLVQRKGMFVEDRHNGHFSPVAYYTKFGILFTIFFYLLLLFSFYYQSLYIKIDKYITLYLGYQLTSFFYSFTVFSLNTDYLFWTFTSLSFLTIYKYKKGLLQSA